MQAYQQQQLQEDRQGPPSHSRGISLQNLEEYQLISQYLTLKPTLPSQASSPQNQQSGASPEDQPLPEGHRPRGRGRKNIKPSSYHNFQKHLMTTLKKYIMIKRNDSSSHSRASIASELWEYFLRSPRPSKRTLLAVLVGGEEGGEGEYGAMAHFFSDYSERQLKLAQDYLCREVIRQSSHLIETSSFEQRRILQSQRFKDYFALFVQQLQARKPNLRIPKSSLPPQ